MKKIRIIILTLLIAFLGLTPISAEGDTNTNSILLLSKMSNEQCYQEIKKLGYVDNLAYASETETAEAVKTIVTYFAEGGTVDSLPFNYTGLVDMAVQIHGLLIKK